MSACKRCGGSGQAGVAFRTTCLWCAGTGRATVASTSTEFTTLDSGERVDFPSGMRRDTDAGKPRYDLVDRPMLKRWAELYARGAVKYGDANWTLADSPEELVRFQASAFRHFMQWLNGEIDEDHAAAVLFNVAAAEHVKAKLA